MGAVGASVSVSIFLLKCFESDLVVEMRCYFFDSVILFNNQRFISERLRSTLDASLRIRGSPCIELLNPMVLERAGIRGVAGLLRERSLRSRHFPDLGS